MRLVLGAHTDFKYEKIALEHFMQERGHRTKFSPSSIVSSIPSRGFGEKQRDTHELIVITPLPASSKP